MLMPRFNLAAPAAAALLLSSGLAFASGTIEETRTVSDSPTIEIENLAGTISVQTWDKPVLYVYARLSKQAEGLDIDGTETRMTIRVRQPKSKGHWGYGGDGGSTLNIKVPTDTSLRVRSVSADIDVQGMTGDRQELQTVSGSIAIVNVAGTVLSAQTVSGNIDSNATTAEQRLRTVSGDINARGAVAMLEAETVSGRIKALDLPPESQLGSVSGDVVAIAKAMVRRVRLSSTSGETEFEGELEKTGILEMESMSGNTVARIRNSPAEIYAKTHSGNIRTKWGDPVKPKYGPGARLDYCTKGEGGVGRIHATSFSGSVRISE